MLVPVPKFEYEFHMFIRKVHSFLTGRKNTQLDEAIINPYSALIKEKLDTLTELEQKACQNMSEYEAALVEVLNMLDDEKDDLKEVFEHPDVVEEEKQKAKAGFYFNKGLINLMEKYLDNADDFLNFMMKQHSESVEELQRITSKYAREAGLSQDIQE